MNGAQVLISTLTGLGVDTCFMNPGTSEIQFVAALDTVTDMRGVLALFEGVATGAADGYARVAGRPAAVLLHLGPGLANGLANLHNARRAHSPVVAVVGDHALAHQRFDAPLQSDIASLARPMSGWLRAATSTTTLAADVTDAVRAACGPPGQVATLAVPADLTWSPAPADAGPVAAVGAPVTHGVDAGAVDEAAKALRSGRAAVLIGGRATDPRGLRAAARAAAAADAKLLCETFPANLHRGAGLPAVERLGYLAEFAEVQLQGLEHLVLADTQAPVSFFAYPGRPSSLVPAGCQVHQLAGGADDVAGALEALAEVLGAAAEPPVQPTARPERPSGPLDAQRAAAAIAALLPEGAIVSDEGNTSGLFVAGATAGCPPHQWLCLTGGAIGQGLPLATGAAVAAPDAKVLCLQADGSAMYTLQALWTQAREGLDVTTVVFNNRSYAILAMELDRVGAEPPGPRAKRMLDLSDPDLDFVSLARGMGVAATRATTADELTAQLQKALAEPGPAVVEAMVGRLF